MRKTSLAGILQRKQIAALQSWISAREASRVYALFGKKGIDSDSLPPLHTPVGETIRYHIRAGKHAVTLYDWDQYLQFASEQLGGR